MRSYTLRQMDADGKHSFQTGFLFNQMKMVQPLGAEETQKIIEQEL